MCALAPGEVLQHVAELVGLDHPEVDLQARVGGHARTSGAAGADRLHDLELGQRLRQRGRVGGGGDDVDVLDRVGPAAQRAGDLDAVRGRVRAQRLDDLLGRLARLPQHDAARRPVLLVLGQHLPEVLLGLDPEAAQLLQATVLDSGGQGVE